MWDSDVATADAFRLSLRFEMIPIPLAATCRPPPFFFALAPHPAGNGGKCDPGVAFERTAQWVGVTQAHKRAAPIAEGG
jgi:hypothetical protein